MDRIIKIENPVRVLLREKGRGYIMTASLYCSKDKVNELLTGVEHSFEDYIGLKSVYGIETMVAVVDANVRVIALTAVGTGKAVDASEYGLLSDITGRTNSAFAFNRNAMSIAAKENIAAEQYPQLVKVFRLMKSANYIYDDMNDRFVSREEVAMDEIALMAYVDNLGAPEK